MRRQRPRRRQQRTLASLPARGVGRQPQAPAVDHGASPRPVSNLRLDFPRARFSREGPPALLDSHSWVRRDAAGARQCCACSGARTIPDRPGAGSRGPPWLGEGHQAGLGLARRVDGTCGPNSPRTTSPPTARARKPPDLQRSQGYRRRRCFGEAERVFSPPRPGSTGRQSRVAAEALSQHEPECTPMVAVGLDPRAEDVAAPCMPSRRAHLGAVDDHQ